MRAEPAHLWLFGAGGASKMRAAVRRLASDPQHAPLFFVAVQRKSAIHRLAIASPDQRLAVIRLPRYPSVEARGPIHTKPVDGECDRRCVWLPTHGGVYLRNEGWTRTRSHKANTGATPGDQLLLPDQTVSRVAGGPVDFLQHRADSFRPTRRVHPDATPDLEPPAVWPAARAGYVPARHRSRVASPVRRPSSVER